MPRLYPAANASYVFWSCFDNTLITAVLTSNKRSLFYAGDFQENTLDSFLVLVAKGGMPCFESGLSSIGNHGDGHFHQSWVAV